MAKNDKPNTSDRGVKDLKMSNPLSTKVSEQVRIVTDLWRRVRLSWNLLTDGRVHIIPKLIPIAGIAYVLSPIDLIPEIIPAVGVLDDVMVITFALDMFVRVVPEEIVLEHARNLGLLEAPAQIEAGEAE